MPVRVASLEELNTEIDEEVHTILSDKCEVEEKRISMPRQWLIMLPNEVGREVLYECVKNLDDRADVDRKNIANLLVFAKTAKVHKQTPLSKKINVRTEPAKIVLELV